MQNKKLVLLTEIKNIIHNRTGAHGLDHILRVRRIALELAKTEKANKTIVEAMALLHDLVRDDALDGQDNLNQTLMLSEQLLIKSGYTKEQTLKILDGIKTHSIHSKYNKPPETIEAKILFDADKIDAVGEIGLARAITVMSKMNLPLEDTAKEYLKAIDKFENDYKNQLYTKSSTELIRPRLEYSKKFMQKILAETKSDKN